jgi:hypothetical protein
MYNSELFSCTHLRLLTSPSPGRFPIPSPSLLLLLTNKFSKRKSLWRRSRKKKDLKGGRKKKLHLLDQLRGARSDHGWILSIVVLFFPPLSSAAVSQANKRPASYSSLDRFQLYKVAPFASELEIIAGLGQKENRDQVQPRKCTRNAKARDIMHSAKQAPIRHRRRVSPNEGELP